MKRVLLIIVICVIAFYFIWGVFRFTSILQDLAHTTYVSRNGNSYIVFNNLKRIDESTLQVNENVLSFLVYKESKKR